MAGALACFLIMTAGCDASADPPSASTTADQEAEAGMPTVEHFPAHVRVVVSGARSFTWEGREDVHVTRAGAANESVNLLSVGFLQPVKLETDPASRFRWAFDLLDEYEDRPGAFTITGATKPGGVQSGAFLTFMRVTDATQDIVHDWRQVELLEDYRGVGQPCTVELSEELAQGSLNCPELTDEQGNAVRVEVDWSAER